MPPHRDFKGDSLIKLLKIHSHYCILLTTTKQQTGRVIKLLNLEISLPFKNTLLHKTRISLLLASPKLVLLGFLYSIQSLTVSNIPLIKTLYSPTIHKNLYTIQKVVFNYLWCSPRNSLDTQTHSCLGIISFLNTRKIQKKMISYL